MASNRRTSASPRSGQKLPKVRAPQNPDKFRPWRLLLKLLVGLYLLVLYFTFTFKWIPVVHPLADFQLKPLPLQDTPPLNLVLFHSISRYWQSLKNDPFHHASILNLWGNIVAFVPLGLLMPLSLAGNLAYLRSLLTGLLLTLSIELTQLVLAVGVWDIDDILLNLTGVLVGLILSVPLKFCLAKYIRE